MDGSQKHRGFATAVEKRKFKEKNYFAEQTTEKRTEKCFAECFYFSKFARFKDRKPKFLGLLVIHDFDQIVILCQTFIEY